MQESFEELTVCVFINHTLDILLPLLLYASAEAKFVERKAIKEKSIEELMRDAFKQANKPSSSIMIQLIFNTWVL